MSGKIDLLTGVLVVNRSNDDEWFHSTKEEMLQWMAEETLGRGWSWNELWCVNIIHCEYVLDNLNEPIVINHKDNVIDPDSGIPYSYMLNELHNYLVSNHPACAEEHRKREKREKEEARKRAINDINEIKKDFPDLLN